MSKIKVLIVEDHPVIVNSIRNELDIDQYEVEDCKDIDCAIRFF